MKFIINREELLAALQKVIGIIGKKHADPVVSHCYINVLTHQLILVGTDLEMELIAKVTLEQAAEPGQATLPARKFMDICKSLPDGSEITLKFSKQRAKIETSSAKFSLACLEPGNFPRFGSEENKVSTLELDPQILLGMLGQTFFSMASQDIRYYLNGIFLQLKNSALCAVGTDGHRLSYCSSPQVGSDFSMILPRRTVLELMRLLPNVSGEITVSLFNSNVQILCQEFSMISKIIEGNFPSYDAILSNKMTENSEIEIDKLKSSLSRVAILSNEQNKGVKMAFEHGGLVLSTNNPAQEGAEEFLDVNYSGKGCVLSFNVTYLLDVLNHLPVEKVSVQFSDNNSGMVLSSSEVDTSSKSIHVIMPMRI